ncbi:MAG: RDD family protein [Bdellovibrionaceae bacterium]|nr:RDD family protein [Pseudobdellovibrionaceae bacterium]
MEDQSARQIRHHIPTLTRRFYAFYIDEGLRITFFLPFFFMNLGELGLFGDPVKSVASLALGIVTYLAFRMACLYFLGASLGKLACGLRVVDRETGGELQPIQVMLRVIADELAIFFAFAPRALALFRWDRTHLSDWIAETRVVSLKEQAYIPELRPVAGSILVLLGLFWGAAAWL